MKYYVGGVMVPVHRFKEIPDWVGTVIPRNNYKWFPALDSLSGPRLIFCHEEDYVAFKLRFQVGKPL